MFRRKRRTKSTPSIFDSSKNTKKDSSNPLKPKQNRLKIFNKESKDQKVVTIKINSNSKHQNTQSYTKLKSPSPSHISLTSHTKQNPNQYIIAAHLQQSILTITVYHAIKSQKWRQEFTQNSFKNMSLYQVSKILIRSIQETAQKSNEKYYKKSLKFKKRKYIKCIKIFEYNGYCYVTLVDSDLPTFELRPINDSIEIIPRKHIRYSPPNIHKNKQTRNDSFTHGIQKWNNTPNYTNNLNLSVNMNEIYRKQSEVSYNSFSPSLGMNSNYSPIYCHSFEDSKTNTTITMEDSVDKGPGFGDSDYHKQNGKKRKDNIKYGFV